MLPTVGRIVHYVLPRGRGKGSIRPAEIVRVWSDTCVNLQVKLDGPNDAGMGQPDALGYDPLVVWASSASRGSPDLEGDEALGKWFWPPRAA